MTESNDEAEVDAEQRSSWVVRGIYAALIAANLWIALDWWAGTEQGEAFLTRCRDRIEAAKQWAAECQGCAERKAVLKKGYTAAKNRMHWQAEKIVTEAAEAESKPEQP